MFFVLRDESGRYFYGIGGFGELNTTEVLHEAKIFKLLLTTGAQPFVCEPAIPDRARTAAFTMTPVEFKLA